MSVEDQRRPRVFLSYSRHSEAHHLLVWRFREFLREHGVDARMDIDGEEQPRDVPKWIAREFDEADHVLSLVSPEYRECFEGDAPRVSGNGVRHEGDLIRTALYSGGTPARDKYLAVVLPGSGVADIPAAFTPDIHTYYEVVDFSEHGARHLLRYLRADDSALTRLDVVIRIDSGPVDGLLSALRDSPALLDVRRRGEVVSAGVEGTEGAVGETIGTTLRMLREKAQESGVEARVAVEHHDQPGDALELTEHEAVGALRTLPGARIVVALAPGARELLVETPDLYPAASSFQRVEGPSAWVAVLGRRNLPAGAGARRASG